MIGSGNRDAAVREALPERGAIRLRPQGRGHDVLEAVPFGIGGFVEQKVLRAGFRNDRLSGLLRLADAARPSAVDRCTMYTALPPFSPVSESG